MAAPSTAPRHPPDLTPAQTAVRDMLMTGYSFAQLQTGLADVDERFRTAPEADVRSLVRQVLDAYGATAREELVRHFFGRGGTNDQLGQIFSRYKLNQDELGFPRRA